ncbi:hypothetical protein BO86DRAFT_117310 [Aspergillus japonicus CBS 114.51]|uniref:Uncharacterized protein n=1 Tax=Aspergillus japonicus CBS 114.51 TaxID=1448312 RepID=A0A8T8X016_ASPJA|nr:hypothetical protein BO86DRAFT_117310 [Aspergillus japonicus CBS 114.51]RAH80899.1 hypothetical protein BO86DRAFT_117310 [Aspergillus japonicus CBS 114.51]
MGWGEGRGVVPFLFSQARLSLEEESTPRLGVGTFEELQQRNGARFPNPRPGTESEHKKKKRKKKKEKDFGKD